MARYFYFNGQMLKFPSEYVWREYDLSSEETGRALDGRAHKDIVARKRELVCTWWSLRDSGDTFTSVMLLDIVKQGVFGTLTCPDPLSATDVAHTMYVGDREATMYGVKNNVSEYKITITFIEQ